jgi:hypothetical protein
MKRSFIAFVGLLLLGCYGRLEASETPKTETAPFGIGFVSMWDTGEQARFEAAKVWSHSWDVNSSLGGFINPIIIPSIWIPFYGWTDPVRLGETGARAEFQTKGLIGAGVFAYATTGDVSTYLPTTFVTTYPERDTVQPVGSASVPDGEDFTLVNDFILGEDAGTVINSARAGLGILGRFKMEKLFVRFQVKLLGGSLADWKPFGDLPGVTFDTKNAAQDKYILYVLGPMLIRNETKGYHDQNAPTYGYTEIMSTDWPLIQAGVLLAINMGLPLSLPDKLTAWINFSFGNPMYVLKLKPELIGDEKKIKFFGEKFNPFITCYQSFTNMMLTMVGIPIGLNRYITFSGIRLRIAILDLYQRIQFGYVQTFTYQPEPQVELAFQRAGDSAPYDTKTMGAKGSLVVRLPAADSVDVTPTYRIKDKADFANRTALRFQQEVGFVIFQIEIGGSVEGVSIGPWKTPDSIVGIPLVFVHNFAPLDFEVFNKTFDLDGTDANPAFDHYQTYPRASFRVYPAMPPVLVVPAPVVRSADGNGQAPIPDVINGETYGSQIVPALTAAGVSDNVSAFSSIVKIQSEPAGTMKQMTPGALFVRHYFTVTATDERGNATTGTAYLEIRDTTPPYFDEIPKPIVVHHTDPAATPVDVPLPTLKDNTDPLPKVVSDSPGVFPIGTTLVTFTATDVSGNTRQAVTQVSVLNDPPVLNLGGPYVVKEGETIELTATHADAENDPVEFSWDLNKDGVFEVVNSSRATFSGMDGPNEVVVWVRGQEAFPGGLTVYQSVVVTVLNVAPTIVGPLSVPDRAYATDEELTIGVEFTDPGTLDTHQVTFVWGDGTTSAGEVSEQAGSGRAYGRHRYAAAGVYPIRVTVTDKDGGAAEALLAEGVKIYNDIVEPRTIQLVRGSVRMDFAPESMTLPQNADGQAKIQFNVRRMSGAAYPASNSKFQLQTKSFNFYSEDIRFLGVAGNRAHFEGKGLVNKTDAYDFFCAVTNDPINGNRLRVKIFNAETGAVLLDTQPNAPDGEEASGVAKKGYLLIRKQTIPDRNQTFGER